MKNNWSILFIILGLCALLLGAFIGVLSSFVYLYPDFLKEIIPFNQLRPMHTTTVVSWIILTATGGIYFYLSKIEKIPLYSPNLGRIHLLLFILISFGIYYSLLSGNMGGREYLEYFPLLTVPVLLGWILFGVNYFKTMSGKIKNWPVYFWMWGTGIIFMIYHLSESHFWIFSAIRDDYIKDLTIQWKSYGSFVGSWNLLVYGTAIYLMAKIKGDDSIGRGKVSFFFYFLGLTNLMFGWALHTYIVSTAPWIRYVAYVVSMTEWVIFIHIIYSWGRSLSKEKKNSNLLVYRFLMISELWVFLNLVLALFMSIPVFNYFAHGTHITVAHSMGTTIGINTTILLSSVAFIVSRIVQSTSLEKNKIVTYGFYTFNISLLLFWFVLITGGVFKAIWISDESNTYFGDLQNASASIFLGFVITGCILFIGMLMMIIPMIKKLLSFYFKKEEKTSK